MKNANPPSPVSDISDFRAWAQFFCRSASVPEAFPSVWPGVIKRRILLIRDLGPNGHSGNKLRKWQGLRYYLLAGGYQSFACPGSLASYNLAALADWAPGDGFSFTAVVKDPETRPYTAAELRLLDHQGKYSVICVPRAAWKNLEKVRCDWQACEPHGIWVPEGICMPVGPVLGAGMAFGMQLAAVPGWNELILDAGTGFTGMTIAAGVRMAGDTRPVHIVPLMGNLMIHPDDIAVDWLGRKPIVHPVCRGYRSHSTRSIIRKWYALTGEMLPEVYAAPLFSWVDTRYAWPEEGEVPLIIHSGG